MAMSGKTRGFIALLFIVLVAFALRSFRLDYDFSNDEGFTCSMVRYEGGYWGIIKSTLALGEPHPVAYYFALYSWSELAGNSEFSGRYMSAFFGVIAVAACIRLTSTLLGRKRRSIAVMAAILCTLNSFVVGHSRDMRMYSMLLAMITLSTAFLWTAAQQNRIHNQKRIWAQFVICSIVAAHTHYYALFVLLAQALWFILFCASQHGRRKTLQWLISLTIIGAIILPWLLVARGVLTGYYGFGTMPTLGEAFAFVGQIFGVGATEIEHADLYTLIGGTLAAIGCIYLLLAKTLTVNPYRLGAPTQSSSTVKPDIRAAALLIITIIIPVGVVWWLSQTRPVFKDRYLIAAVIPYHILIATGVWALITTSKWVPSGSRTRNKALSTIGPNLAIGMGGILLVGVLGSLSNYLIQSMQLRKGAYAALGQTIHHLSTVYGGKQDAVEWAMNYPDYGFTCALGTPKYWVLPPKPSDIPSSDLAVQEMVTRQTQRVLFVPVHDLSWDKDNIAVHALSKYFTPIAEVNAGAWPVTVFSRPRPESLVPINAVFQNGCILEAASIIPDIDGRLVEIHLRWTGDPTKLSGDEKIFVHVMHLPDSVLVTQLDTPLTNNDLKGQIHSYGIHLPNELPRGQYRVYGGLYSGNKPGIPRVPTLVGADTTELFTFSME